MTSVNFFQLTRHASSLSGHYKALGLQPPDPHLNKPPTQREIKDAYLKVVRQHHPDVSEAPESAEKFRRAQEAFEALSNSLEHTQPEEYEYDVDGRKRRRGGEGPGPSEDRIKEMLWREEMLKKRQAKKHKVGEDYEDILKRETKNREDFARRVEQEQIFFRLWTALGVGLFVSFVIFRFLLERDPSHQAYIQATNALEIEAHNKRVDERNYRMSKEYAIEKQKIEEETRRKQWEVVRSQAEQRDNQHPLWRPANGDHLNWNQSEN